MSERANASEPRERSGDLGVPASERVGGSGGAKPPGGIDHLRQQLRVLGYLDAGVDRFVLAPAHGRRGPLSVAAGASVRVSVLAAVLLGPAGAVGLAGRLPGLVSGVRDALVLAIYLSTLFFLAAGALALVVTAAAALLVRPGATFARRARVVSSAAGWIATIGCLAYLTFWWRNANAGFGWSAPVWTTFALLLAVLISLLLGHAVRIATLGVAAARDEGRDALPPVHSRSWRVTVVAGAVAFAGCAAVLVLTASADGPTSVTPPLTVVSAGAHVRLIAIDGVDTNLVESQAWTPRGPLIGARYHVSPHDTSDPARAWTTIATGEPPEVHGIQALEARRVAGLRGIVPSSDTAAGRIVRAATDVVRLTRPSLTTREQRKSVTMWEVAEQAGLRVAVVNWWATWPASSRGAMVISDRALLRLETGGALDAEIAPADLYGVLQRRWSAIRDRAARVAENGFADVTDPDVAATLRRSAALDAAVVGIVDALPGPARDLDVVYLPGLDIAQHALLAAGSEGGRTPSAVADRVAALRGYYAFLGKLLQPWLTPGNKDAVVLVTQPGRVASPAPGMLAMLALPPPDWQPSVREGADATVLDVAPTVLSILGLPLSRELPGQPLAGLPFGAEKRYVTTYGRPFAAPVTGRGKPLDQEMIDRLRSLGYVR